MPLLSTPEFLQLWLGGGPLAAGNPYPLLLALVLGVLGALYLLFGGPPRRRRALRRARHLLQNKQWQEALGTVLAIQARGLFSEKVRKQLGLLEAECHRVAGSDFLQQKEYEKALEHLTGATRVLAEPEGPARTHVVEAMLAEARRLFAASTGPDTAAPAALLTRILLVQSPCPEASFWLALCQLREGKPEQAAPALREVAAAEEPRTLDPLLYLGALLLRRGEPREALRYLTEANRSDGNCPFVIAQLGTAMIDAGGDPQIATRALQRALGPRGLLLWKQEPRRAWVEGLPEDRSYVRRLAAQHPYVCPLWGSDLQPLLRQANTALGEGFYRLGNYSESAEVFTRLLQEAAPSLAVLRGLGLALTRLERFDQAFIHLRAAHELAPEDRGIAGYLALCGARGKPTRPEDKASNVAWAVWLVGQYSAPGDREWAGLLATIFAEAQAHGVPVAVPDQVHLCAELESVKATDPLAAAAYHHLQASDPGAVRPEYAWLYCRAAQQHGLTGEHALELFARTFQEEAAARFYFAEQSWDFEDVEYAYLERTAALAPGQFPAALGPDYPARGEELLLGRAGRLEEAGQADAALAAAEVLLKLAPGSARAHDRLAQLHYRRGQLERALELLEAWGRLDPTAHLPQVRQAVICQQRGDLGRCAVHLRRALDLTHRRLRADVAFLGARLTLGCLLNSVEGGSVPRHVAGQSRLLQNTEPANGWEDVLKLLAECLREDPGHLDALWCQAAVQALRGDQKALAAQAAAMNRPEVGDPRFHFLAAVCHLAGGNHAGVLEACQRIAADADLAVESAYLLGWAYLQRGEPATAALMLQRVAQVEDSPSAAHAQALLGEIRFHQGAYDEAAQWWQRLPAERRAAWQFDGPLAGTVFLAALTDLQAGRYEEAATRFREAGQHGLRDRRLGPLLALALFKAGQQLLYAGNGPQEEGRVLSGSPLAAGKR
jgi:tetratricopeptide (TPR) repeat protein